MRIGTGSFFYYFWKLVDSVYWWWWQEHNSKPDKTDSHVREPRNVGSSWWNDAKLWKGGWTPSPLTTLTSNGVRCDVWRLHLIWITLTDIYMEKTLPALSTSFTSFSWVDGGVAMTTASTLEWNVRVKCIIGDRKIYIISLISQLAHDVCNWFVFLGVLPFISEYCVDVLQSHNLNHLPHVVTIQQLVRLVDDLLRDVPDVQGIQTCGTS